VPRFITYGARFSEKLSLLFDFNKSLAADSNRRVRRQRREAAMAIALEGDPKR
jgi:hypothetical protein